MLEWLLQKMQEITSTDKGLKKGNPSALLVEM